MENINILFINCGRRVELIEQFRKAYNELQIEGKIITCDIVNTAPACYFGDKNYVVSKKTEKDFLNGIINICNKESINLVIPLIDPDLYILARNKVYIESKTISRVLVSDENVIDICQNKMKTYRFSVDNDFDVPTVLEDTVLKDIALADMKGIKFPLFIKPIDGSASENIFKIKNNGELEFFKKYIKNPIIQEFIEGKEYTVDAFLDFDSKIISIVPRLRIKVRAGEVLVSKTIMDESLIESTKNILNTLKPIGPITLQFIKKDNKNYLIEINPRFGGGCPLSINAGAKSPLWLLKLILKIDFKYKLTDFQSGLIMMRYDQSVFKEEQSL